MDRRTLLRGGLGAAGAVVLGSCRLGRNDEDNGSAPGDVTRPSPRVTLRMPGGQTVGFPSPFTYDPGTYQLVAYVYDTLLLNDSTGRVIPWLASDYEASADGLTHTFRLRENVFWHDGKPFTAEDVVFTFDYFEKHRATLPPFVLFKPEGIASVNATGPHSVQIVRDKPSVTFARDTLSTFVIFPRHIWSTVADPAKAQDRSLLVGTGPYRIDAYRPAQGAFLLVANDNFFLGKPFVKRIEFKPVGDEATALVAGQTDAAYLGGEGAASAVQALRNDRRFGVLSGPLDSGVFLYFDQTKGGPAADPDFRKAVAFAVDRPGLVRRLLGGQGAPGNPGFLPPDHPSWKQVEQYRFNRTAANRLLDRAGYTRAAEGGRVAPGGQPLRIKTSVIPDLSSAFELVERNLRAVGIQILADPIEPIAFFSGRPVGTEVSMRPLLNLAADADFMRNVFSSGVEQRFFSPAGYSNPEFDRLADEQKASLDHAKRQPLLNRMQQIIAADLPLLPLYYVKPFFAYRKSVFDQWSFEPNGGGPTNKQTLVTGLKSGGTQIRPVKIS